MTEYRSTDPIDIQAHIEAAHRMRAEYLRASLVEFVQTIKRSLSKLADLFNVPRTEQL